MERVTHGIEELVLIMRRTRTAGLVSLLLPWMLACSGEIGGGDGLAPFPGAGENDPTTPGGTNGGPVDSSSGGSGTPGTGGALPGDTSNPGNGGTPGTTDAPAEEVLDALRGARALPLVLHGNPEHYRVVRLTHPQWENSTRALLAIDDTGQRQNLAEDLSGFHAFSNHEELLFLNASLYSDYQLAAEELVALADVSGSISAIYPGNDAQGFISTVGRRAFRRPLTQDETRALQNIYDEGAALSENGSTPHARGAAMVLQALLQSPNYLYRVELTSPGSRLSGYELAAKLSLLLRGTAPSDALLDAAEAGQLDSDDGVRNLASQMLDEASAGEVMRSFHGELFRFNRYLTITKMAVEEYDPELNEELQEAAYKFFDRIYEQGLGVTDILTSTVGYVGPHTAPLYGVQLPNSGGGAFGGFGASPQPQGLQEMDLGSERPGFFTQLPFLVLNSVNLVPDPIHRGVELNHSVLCAEIPLPGAVDTTLPSAQAGETNRERVDAASGVGTCGETCHAPYINPLGFAFESYDGMGRLRETDNGSPVVTEASYPFTEGLLTFSGAPQLMEYMAEGEQSHACYSKNLATFALQRELSAADKALVDSLTADSRSGASVKDLLLAIVTSPAFTTRVAGGAQ